MLQQGAIAMTATLLSLMPTVAAALPVQVGVYHNQTRIFQLAARGERVCYQGFSGNRLVTASLSRDRRNEGFYAAHNLEEWFYQQDLETVLAGPLHDLQVYRLTNEYTMPPDAILLECLDDDGNFYEAIETVG